MNFDRWWRFRRVRPELAPLREERWQGTAGTEYSSDNLSVFGRGASPVLTTHDWSVGITLLSGFAFGDRCRPVAEIF
jgi:hypothetical protein